VKALEKVVDGLSQRAGLALVAEWEKMDVVSKKVNGVWVSVFEASLPKGVKGKFRVPYSVSVSGSDHNPGPPTQKKAYEKLIQDEKIAELAGMDSTGGVQLINMALHIEHEQ
jgi:hypothetical protein